MVVVHLYNSEEAFSPFWNVTFYNIIIPPNKLPQKGRDFHLQNKQETLENGVGGELWRHFSSLKGGIPQMSILGDCLGDKKQQK